MKLNYLKGIYLNDAQKISCLGPPKLKAIAIIYDLRNKVQQSKCLEPKKATKDKSRNSYKNVTIICYFYRIDILFFYMLQYILDRIDSYYLMRNDKVCCGEAR